MKTFQIEVEFKKTYTIHADTREEALEKAESQAEDDAWNFGGEPDDYWVRDEWGDEEDESASDEEE